MSAREGQTFGGESLLARYASFVKLPHTLFALPFAGVGAVLASYGHAAGITVSALLWIAVAFTAARFAAMGFNRIVDRRWDALNPRTRMRELPTGRLSVGQASGAVTGASLLFVFAAWQLNPLCGLLAPVALGWIFFYSFSKRFTAWSHHVLGLALGIAPAGAYLAVAGEWSQPWYLLPLIAAAVMFWVAGFDIIYAVQDTEFDRTQGLHSLPAKVGVIGALRLARAFHAIAVAVFAAVWLVGGVPVGWLYLAGVGVMAALLHYGHALLRGVEPERLDLQRIDRAFFRINVAVSTTFLTFTLLDRIFLR
jgi:4-hydroxybenzoate polyprenyltransferase